MNMTSVILNEAVPALPATKPTEESSPIPQVGNVALQSQISTLLNIVFFKENGYPNLTGHVIGITSPIHGEGVTTIAGLAARELAKIERNRTLLVSTEALERISHKHLENFESLWTKNRATGYWEPSSLLLSSERNPNNLWNTDLEFRNQIITELRVAFSNVLLDCRPARGGSDIVLLSSMIDGFVIVVKSGGSTRDQLNDTVRVMQLTNSTIKGCCFNRRTSPIPARIQRWLQR